MISGEDEDLLRLVVEHSQPSMRVVGSLGRHRLTMDPEEGRRTTKICGEGWIMSAKTVIEKDGKDLVVTLPQEILDDLGVKIGDHVDISIRDGKIVIARKDTSGG